MAPVADQQGLVAVQHFVQATRDSGYLGLAEAISELLDNSLQAGARNVTITIAGNAPETTVAVRDDGCGMSRDTLITSLRFGGSTRFNDRAGLGRFGMGLPNASLSQARRVTVYSWMRTVPASYTYIDLDEIAAGHMQAVPSPIPCDASQLGSTSRSGTMVVWSKCDRIGTGLNIDDLRVAIGRRFRYFIWNGIRLTLNGSRLEAFDPLFLRGTQLGHAARVGDEVTFRVKHSDAARNAGTVTVAFTELPIRRWHVLSNDQKQAHGISNGAGVSIVRAGREIAYGWHFLTGKRRENYDDWWRCEIRFEPTLDEVFGVSHTKQQIRPSVFVKEILTPYVVSVARMLNGRVRKTFQDVRISTAAARLERRVARADMRLQPIPRALRPKDKVLLKHLQARKDPGAAFRLVVDSLPTHDFYSAARTGKGMLLALNQDHPFYRQIYEPLIALTSSRDKQTRALVDLFLLSLGRADTVEGSRAVLNVLAKHRKRWSDAMATYLLG